MLVRFEDKIGFNRSGSSVVESQVLNLQVITQERFAYLRNVNATNNLEIMLEYQHERRIDPLKSFEKHTRQPTMRRPFDNSAPFSWRKCLQPGFVFLVSLTSVGIAWWSVAAHEDASGRQRQYSSHRTDRSSHQYDGRMRWCKRRRNQHRHFTRLGDHDLAVLVLRPNSSRRPNCSCRIR